MSSRRRAASVPGTTSTSCRNKYVGRDYANPIGPDGRIILTIQPDKVNTPKSMGR